MRINRRYRSEYGYLEEDTKEMKLAHQVRTTPTKSLLPPKSRCYPTKSVLVSTLTYFPWQKVRSLKCPNKSIIPFDVIPRE